MRRRELLGSLCLCSALAGCESDGEDRPTRTGPTPTGTDPGPETERSPAPATATPSPTPMRYRPTVTAAALVSGWSDPGDLEGRRIETVTRGRPAVVAFRYRVRVPAGRSRFWESATVWGPEGEERARVRREAYREAEEAGANTWEDAVAFDTTEWNPGEYRADVAIGNLELHRVSDPFSFTFGVDSR